MSQRGESDSNRAQWGCVGPPELPKEALISGAEQSEGSGTVSAMLCAVDRALKAVRRRTMYSIRDLPWRSDKHSTRIRGLTLPAARSRGMSRRLCHVKEGRQGREKGGEEDGRLQG